MEAVLDRLVYEQSPVAATNSPRRHKAVPLPAQAQAAAALELARHPYRWPNGSDSKEAIEAGRFAYTAGGPRIRTKARYLSYDATPRHPHQAAAICPQCKCGSSEVETAGGICLDCREANNAEYAAAWARELGIGEDDGQNYQYVREMGHRSKVIGGRSRIKY